MHTEKRSIGSEEDDSLSWLWRAAGFSTWAGLAPGVLALLVLVLIDAAVGTGVVVPSAYLVSPLIAALSGGRRATVAAGALAVACAALSGAWNDNFGSGEYWILIALMTAASSLAVLAAGSIADRVRLTLANADLSSDLKRSEQERIEVGEILQQSLRQPPLPDIPGWLSAALYRPAGGQNRIGGDFYDAFRVEGGWMLVIGDVTGRGARAAAVTAQARYTLRTAATLTADPVAAFASLNAALLGRRDSALCTVAALSLSEDLGRPMRLAVAGHPPPLLVHGEDLVEVGGGGPVLGAFEDASWAIEQVEISPEQLLVVVTDGVIEATGPGGRFGEERLRKELAGTTSPEVAARRVEEALDSFAGAVLEDDAALLAISPATRSRARV